MLSNLFQLLMAKVCHHFVHDWQYLGFEDVAVIVTHSLSMLYVQLVQYLFPGLLDGVVIDLHLLGKILFEPFVFFDVFVDELDCQHTVNLYGSFT